ncbi:MAG TPA: dATP/dGTP diphosphohydrolase domain-containing protein [Steroidobacteraceae bacterium]|nr:dATP/dGTP diphosphohydrolase domain-containing protein [Steroidobacteraceae bacterium]
MGKGYNPPPPSDWRPGGVPAGEDITPLVVVGDLESAARGSGARMNGNKPELHQVPMWALYGVARVLMYGAKKYKPGNWAKGMPWTVVYDCALRHLAAWQRGEENDEESGLPHLDHALCNLIFLSAYRDLYPEGDDRWPEFRKGGVK